MTTSAALTAVTSYSGASSHYLSPDRRDPVKRFWEEPVNHRVLASAVDRLPSEAGPLRVLDVGAGTGDGLALLDRGMELTSGAGRAVDYVGLDPDPEMVDTARSAHEGRSDARFVHGDVRDELPVDDVDMYLSAGVPYSHLGHDEFREVLARILDAAGRADHPCAVVLDVLGQYSLEWEPSWDSDRWDYRMSFFEGADAEDDGIAAPMSFHSRWSVRDALLAAQEDTGVELSSVDYVDRSVVVGRHTTTGAFNPSLPDYRGLVNRLYDGDTTLDLDGLRLRAPGSDAPDAVTSFYGSLVSLWNARLDHACEHEVHVRPDAAARRRLADTLCALEHGVQQGLGTGHSLICTAITQPRA